MVVLGKRQKRSGPTPDKIQSSSRAQERTILENARRLAENPDLAEPECKDGCVWFSPIKKARKHVRRVAEARGDEDKLEKYASKGSYYARAYAVLLLAEERGKVPYLAPVQLPWGSSYVANWGDAPKEILLGLQHWHDRKLRLLAVKKYMESRSLHFYATEDRIVCTAKSPDPPEEFVEEKLGVVGVGDETGPDRPCPHGGPDDVGGGVDITWKSPDVTIRLCHRCLGDGNTVHEVLEHVMAPDPWTDFDVDVQLPALETHEPGLEVPPDPDLPGDLRERYLKGVLGDQGLFERAQARRRAHLSDRSGLLLVAGGILYGDDVDPFLDALDPGPAEREALKAALEAHESPLILDRGTAGEALEELWPEHGLRCLEAVTQDRDLAEEFHGQDLAAGDNLSALLRRAAKRADRARLSSALPTYDDLPPALAFADEAARAHRLDGKEGAMQVVKNRTPEDGNARAVSWALCLTLGEESGREWKYGSTEMELGQALEDHVGALLEAEPDAYHDIMTRIASVAGIGRIDPPSSGPGS